MLDRLPESLVHVLLLEWLSPESVWSAVRASGVLRRAALTTKGAVVKFRAAEGEVLSDACIRWFREHRCPLALWTCVAVSDKIAITFHSNYRDTAALGPNESRNWYQNGKLHRDGDLPAKMWANGTMHWYQNGACHRDGDLPAVVCANGLKAWYQHDKQHRDGDQPAEIWANGHQEWYQHDKRHRDGDLPAIIGADGTQEWYQNGKCHRDGDLPAYIGADGTQVWYQNDKLHRVLWSDGTKHWYVQARQENQK